MDLNYTDAERAFRDELREWLQKNIPSDWQKRNSSGESMEENFAYLRAWQKRVHEGGWAGVSWSREYGGRGATLIEPTIIAHGTEAQKQRFLSKILSAEEIWCQGFSEPNAGSDLASLSTEARLENDRFVVNGHKVWTSFGWAADWCELVARTDASAARHRGLTVLLVDMRSPGVEVRPLRQMT